ncbi:MAG TPA: alpha/beta hydrolase [Candidatus Competibacteraceae bacterium]|nr:alpha/beta hydrolase [Candidatus Competibacteraceae bacterium]
MQLEFISRYPATEHKTVPLLFVHGSFTGAGVWDAHFLPYFAAQGYAAHALSLRGHGASAGRERLFGWSLADYVADLTYAIRRLECLPVLIGHSMGGMVVQKYLESRRVPAVVLMASVPPHGLLPSYWGMVAGNPLLLSRIALFQALGPRFANLELMRQALFSEDTPDAWLQRHFHLLQRESQRVCLDMLGLDPLRLKRDHSLPMLVMAAGRDAFFSTGLMQDMARYYRADLALFPDLAHAMMLEMNWQQAAEYLLYWLGVRFAR